MYATIMSLPLFKGVSHDQISAFLEKTHINFKNYLPGDSIARYGDNVRIMRCLISGSVVLSYPLGKLMFREQLPAPNIVGGDRLFGIDTTLPYDIKAGSACSIMQFSKEQFMSLLISNHICLINYLNFLSLRAQRVQNVFNASVKAGFGPFIKRLICTYADRSSRQVSVVGDTADLSDASGIPVPEIGVAITALATAGLVQYDGTNLFIPDKQAFLEAV